MTYIYLLTIDHRDGSTVSVHATEEGARKALAAHVRDQWPSDLPPDSSLPTSPDGLSDEDAIRAYYAAMEGLEAYDIECLPVLP